MGRNKLFSIYFRKRTVYLSLVGALCRAVLVTGCHQKSTGASFKQMYLSGTVSVAMALPLFCFVMAKPEKHMVGREPVLPIAGELALAQ